MNLKTKVLSLIAYRARDKSHGVWFSTVTQFFSTLRSQKGKILSTTYYKKKHMAEVICVTHLTASATCVSAAAQSLWQTPRCSEKQQYSVHLCCVLPSSKWRIPNPCCSGGEVMHLNNAPINEKWGKLCRRVLNLNLPVHFIKCLDQVRRLHCMRVILL